MNIIKILFAAFIFIISIIFSVQSQVLDSPRDGIYDKIHTDSKKPIPYYPVREADVAWKKRVWRTMDLRQKINHPFFYPETRQRDWKNFITVILDAVLIDGSITAYLPDDDQFLIAMTIEEVKKRILDTEIIPEYDINDPTRVIGEKEVIKDFNSSEVIKIRIKEDWFFDKQRSVMDVRIIGICPLMKYYDNSGNYAGEQEMFWIYYPEARPIFAIAEVFNRNNSAEKRTYDELFWKRMFGSYIYQEENVYNREIIEYASGMDALLEAERIKNELFEFEHDLWEF